MMTQGVMTQAVNLFGNTTGSVTLKGKQTSSSFDLMIDSTMKSGSGKAGNTESSTVKKASNQSNDMNKNEKSDVVNGSTKQEKDTTQGITKNENTKTAAQADNQTQKAEDANQTEDVKNNQTEDTTVDETTLEQIAGMLQAVKETVIDLLNLSAEELNQLLSSQGMELVDLLQPANLQQIVLADSGVNDILTVLTDENLAGNLKQLLQSVEDIKSEANLGMSLEQIKNMIDNAELLRESQKVTSQEGITEEINKKESKPEEAVKTSNTRLEDTKTGAISSGEGKDIQIEVTKVTDMKESSSQSQSDPSKSQNQDLKATEQLEVFMSNLTKASTSTQVDFNGNLVQTTEIREIANQIIQKIRVTIQPGQTSMEMQLNPENLGKVNLSVQSKNGVMTAQFVVQNEISREAIESQLHTLRETLNQQGIKVEAIEVTVATYSFEQNSRENTDGQTETKKSHSGNRISLDEALMMSEDSEETSSQVITDDLGSQIDYTA